MILIWTEKTTKKLKANQTRNNNLKTNPDRIQEIKTKICLAAKSSSQSKKDSLKVNPMSKSINRKTMIK